MDYSASSGFAKRYLLGLRCAGWRRFVPAATARNWRASPRGVRPTRLGEVGRAVNAKVHKIQVSVQKKDASLGTRLSVHTHHQTRRHITKTLV